MSLRVYVCAAVVLLGVPATVRAQRGSPSPLEYPVQEHYTLRLEYRDFHPTLSGEIQKGSGDEVGTLIDPKKDLGIGDVSTFEGRGTIQFRRGHKLRLSYTRLNYHGDVAEIRRSFTFQNTHYARFDRVATAMKGAYYSAAYEWDLIKGTHGYLGALVGAKAVDVDWLIVDVPQGQRERDTLRAPVPAIGGTARIYAGRFSFEGELSGLTIGSRGSVYEAEASLRVHLSDRLAGVGGYRRLSIRGEDGRDHGKVILGGFHYGIEMSL